MKYLPCHWLRNQHKVAQIGRTLFTFLFLASLSTSAMAATDLTDPIMRLLRFVSFFVAAAIMIAIAFGVLKGLGVAFGLKKLKEPNQDPDIGRKLMIDGFTSIALIAFPALLIMAVVTFFGSTEVINFMMGNDGGLSTGDMINLNQGQGTGTGG